MAKKIVAVVGRPNVGKSTLFNKLAGERVSIVEDTPGVTRDRIYFDVDWREHTFTLIDTGGLDFESEDMVIKEIREQAELAIDTADVILFVCDGKIGIHEADREVAELLRKSKKPVVLAVNKVDNMQKDNFEMFEFYELGIGEPIPISSTQALNLGELLDAIVLNFKNVHSDNEEDDSLKVAIIGKPNVGKSSLVNKIIGKNRVIVSDIPGTTRDAIDSPFKWNGRDFTLIDTAGMRRKSKIKENIERYSIIRAIAAIERSDVCVMLIDAEEGVTDQDAKIVGLAHNKGKGIVLAINKWDIIDKEDNTMREYDKEVLSKLAYLSYAPRVYISAKTGQRVEKLLESVVAVSENNAMRVATGVLNEVLYEAMAITQPPAIKGKPLRIFYITQVSVKPPTFILFVNNKELIHFSYKRYIENQLRDAFGFQGTAIHFIIREKTER